MTTHDTWILVSIPSRSSARGIAARIGLLLLGWSERHPDRTPRSAEPVRTVRPLPAQRPFC